MNNTLILVANGFNRDNVQLQPWRYVYELAKHKSKTNNVIVITQGSLDSSIETWIEGFSVVETRYLSVKKQLTLANYIISLNPAELWWSTTPRTIAFYPVLSRLACNKVLFITCPLYKWTELIRASLSGVPFAQTRALWAQRAIPRFLFSGFLNGTMFDCIVVQSQSNLKILEGYGVNKEKLYQLPVGIDEEDINPVNEHILGQVERSLNRKPNEFIFLYLGALRPIRGFDQLIKAFPGVIKSNKNARLVVLARGATKEQCDKQMAKLKIHGLAGSVSIIGGWLSREELWSYIELADVITLPFVLVPSDIPIAVLESLARGKPVVVSPVDGLPELAKGRGIIVDPLKTQQFSKELYLLTVDKQRVQRYIQAATQFMGNYPRWSDVGRLMDKICCANKQSN